MLGGAATLTFDGAGAVTGLKTAKGDYADKEHLLAETVVHVSSPAQRKAWAASRRSSHSKLGSASPTSSSTPPRAEEIQTSTIASMYDQVASLLDYRAATGVGTDAAPAAERSTIFWP